MDEDIAIPLIIFSFILILVWMLISYGKWKYREKQEARQASASSVGTGELKAMMREAVEEAIGPLAERIETLEDAVRRAETPRLPPAQPDEFLEEISPRGEEAAVPTTRRA